MSRYSGYCTFIVYKQDKAERLILSLLGFSLVFDTELPSILVQCLETKVGGIRSALNLL